MSIMPCSYSRSSSVIRRVLLALAVCADLSTAEGQAVVINEVMSSNGTTLFDEDGDTPDWIELYNPGSAAVSLDGHGLSDGADPFKWRFPSVSVPSKGYLLVLASGKDRRDGAAHWETVVDRGDTWSYLIPASEPAPAWRSPGYDDASWGSGASGIGYGDDDDQTQVPAGTISVYARKTFQLDDPAKVSHVFLDIDFDDAFVAFLNGVEIARDNIGTPGGAPPAYGDVATTFTEPRLVTGGKLLHRAVESPASILRAGENVLAIQVHNTGSGSSDLTLIPLLTLGMEEAPAGARGPAEIVRSSLPTLHSSFQIAAEGETITLTSSGGVLLDSVPTGSLPTDISMGRFPDGSATFSYHDAPTPGKPNSSAGYPALGELPAFSHAGGFYPAPIALSLSAQNPAATIHFTLEGSEPTSESPVYTSPISVSTTTVVRARVLAPGSLPGDTVTQTFLIQVSPTLPVVSISTNPENFFDSQIGIYVTGDTYDPNFPYFGSNFWEDWERPVHLELYERDGTLGFSAGAGAKIFGGWSRGNPQRSLAFFARNRHGPSRIQYRIFPGKDIESFEGFVLRNSGNDWNITHFRDAMMTSLLEDLTVDRQAYRPAKVYINGQYWGILNLREKVNEHFLASNHEGVDADQVDLLELNGSVLHGDGDHYAALLALLQNNDVSDPAIYEQVKGMMDVENFIDYQASMIYFDNTDWPGNNIKFWRPRTEDGRWRWIMFDTDFGFGIWNPNNFSNNTLAFALEPNGPGWPNPPWSTFLLRRMVTNEEFVRTFVNRFATHLNTIFRADKVVARINQMQGALSTEMPAHLARWGGTMSAWTSNVQVLRDFANRRISQVRSHLAGRFQLGLQSVLQLAVTPPGSGAVAIQGLEIPSYPWSGTYFRGVPIDIEARPRPGYRFIGWTGVSPEDQASSSVVLTGNLQVTASFEIDCALGSRVVINEINYNGLEGADPGDWVEIHNPGLDVVDLSGWTFRDESDVRGFPIPHGTRLEAGDYLVLCANVQAFAALHAGTENRLGDLGFSFSGNGELLRLLDASGEIVDSVTYGDASPWPEEADGLGSTLALKNPFLDNADAVSWAASAPGGTPGSRNDVFVEVEGSCGEAWQRFRRGDSNSDGKVDLADPIATLRFLFVAMSLSSCPDARDANDDGAVDILDAVATLLHLFTGTVTIPAPGPTACDADPTLDTLSCESGPICN